MPTVKAMAMRMGRRSNRQKERAKHLGHAAHVRGSSDHTGFFGKNSVSFLVLALGTGVLVTLLPCDFGFFLIAVAPGLRPAPGRYPPLRPLTPTMPARSKGHVTYHVTNRIDDKYKTTSSLYKDEIGCTITAFEN